MKPHFSVSENRLQLDSTADGQTSLLGQKIASMDYTSYAQIDLAESTAWSGIALIGHESRFVAALAKQDTIEIVSTNQNEKKTLSSHPLANPATTLSPKAEVLNNTQLFLSYSIDGESYLDLNTAPIDISHLPPWDRAVRIGLASTGEKGTASRFIRFELKQEIN